MSRSYNTVLNLEIYKNLASRLSLALAVYTLCRVAFFVINRRFYEDITILNFLNIFRGGFRFDLVSLFYCNMLFIFLWLLPFNYRYSPRFHHFSKWLFIGLNGLVVFANIADSIYFEFTKSRSTYSIISEFKNEPQLGSMFSGFAEHYWPYIFFILALVAVLIIGYGKDSKLIKPKFKLISFFAQISIFLASALLMIIAIRGGMGMYTRPITLSNAGEYCEKPTEMALVLNTPFSIIRTLSLKDLDKKNYFSDTELNDIYTPVILPSETAVFKKKNIVVLIVESFGKEYTGAYNDYKGYTPFLDSLVGVSSSFKYSYANGSKSIDAIPSSITGVPYVQDHFILSKYASRNHLNSFANLLKPKGYTSAFMHGAPNGSMGFWAFCKQMGFDQYFGYSEFNNETEFDGTWGIWDEPFLSFSIDKMNGLKQPFYNLIFTLSSHDPFKIPEKYTAHFPKGTLPIHQCIGYTDYALRMFFEKAKTMPWYANTIFVITADHTNQTEYAEYKTEVGFQSIPIFMFDPSGEMKRSMDPNRNMQQIDILPSVLGFLGYDEPFISFGKNVFDDTKPNSVFNFKNETYQYYEDQYVLQLREDKVVGFYNFRNDVLLKENLVGKGGKKEKLMLKRLKATIQQYHNRMLADDLMAK
jgi:phosphoglycerol transferase MdoB-like AlkP superfamily enzyme